MCHHGLQCLEDTQLINKQNTKQECYKNNTFVYSLTLKTLTENN